MFTPFFNRVILERPNELAEKAAKSSLIIPEQYEKKYRPTKGTLVAVGPTCDDSVIACKGKTVWFAKYAGDWIKEGNKEIFICNDEDLLGVGE